jgi:transposase
VTPLNAHLPNRISLLTMERDNLDFHADGTVAAAITRTWSTGPVEGHNHRLKLIKRRGYGRASFALERRRVLAA